MVEPDGRSGGKPGGRRWREGKVKWSKEHGDRNDKKTIRDKCVKAIWSNILIKINYHLNTFIYQLTTLNKCS